MTAECDLADMATPSKCLNCGAPLSGDARQGFCQRCLFLQAGARMFEEGGVVSGEWPGASDQSSIISDQLGNRFGDYELLEER